MKNEHTAGPWHAEPTPSSDFVTRRIFGPNGEKVCDVGVPQRSNLDVHTEVANANLIKAAPQMLKALRWLKDEYCEGGAFDDTEAESIIRDAIAAADSDS